MTRLFAPVAALLLASAVACAETAGAPSRDPERANADAAPSASAESSSDSNGRKASPNLDASAECTYEKVEGTISITKIEAPSQLEQACKNDGRHVSFSFAADSDAGASEIPASLTDLDVAVRRLTDEHGYAPGAECLTKLGVVVGATFRASRQLATQGTCSPVIYEPEIDFTTCTCEK